MKPHDLDPTELDAPPKPELPALRTFRVTVERRTNLIGVQTSGRVYRYETTLVVAHSYVCDGDAAKFYIASLVLSADGWEVVTQSPRTLRPYVDVEEVFTQTEQVN